jgi:hypothetical protein
VNPSIMQKIARALSIWEHSGRPKPSELFLSERNAMEFAEWHKMVWGDPVETTLERMRTTGILALGLRVGLRS